MNMEGLAQGVHRVQSLPSPLHPLHKISICKPSRVTGRSPQNLIKLQVGCAFNRQSIVKASLNLLATLSSWNTWKQKKHGKVEQRNLIYDKP